MGLFSSCVGATGNQPPSAAASLTNQTSCARRLYDIANVFCSIGLVRKSCAPATDNRRKKRLYDWTGPVPTATATPLRPPRQAVVAPSASPGSGRAKRHAGDTPQSARKKSRGLDLEASIRKAEQEADAAEQGTTAVAHNKVLQHPLVTALKGGAGGGGGGGGGGAATRMVPPPPLNGGRVTADGASKRAMLMARSLDTSAGASVLTSLASASSASSSSSLGVKPSSSLFNPPNAKDSTLSPFAVRGGVKLSAPPALPKSFSSSTTSTTPSSSCTTSSSSSSSSASPPPHAAACSCSCASDAAREPPTQQLVAQIEQLQKELADAKAREQSHLQRIDELLQQLRKDATASSHHRLTPGTSALLLTAGSSPLTSLAFSPFQGFASLTASPSPFSGANFFSTGLTGSGSRSGRPPFTRKVARVGPHLVDPTSNDDDAPPVASPHLSPATTSIASALLLSPLGGDKENRAAGQLHLLSPLRVAAVKSEGRAPSTPPCNLMETAASLLNLTPSQLPAFSPSIGRIFATDPCESDTEDEDLNVKTERGAEEDNQKEDARVNAASPEPRTVRTPASLGAPSSPSPSAKNAKALARHHARPHHPHHIKVAASVSSSSSPASFAAVLEGLSPLATARVADCLSK